MGKIINYVRAREAGVQARRIARLITNTNPLLAPLPAAPEAQAQGICRNDGRCQYAIDHGAEGLGHCPTGKCVMPALPAEVREALKVAREALAAMLENRGDYTANRDAARAALARLDALGGGQP